MTESISTPGRIGRPPKGAEQAVTARILDVATQLFLANGFSETSTTAIALAANCSKRTIYARFASKADLLQAVVERFATARVGQFDHVANGDATLPEQLHAIAEIIVAEFEDREVAAFRALLRSESVRFPEVVRTSISAGLDPAITRVAGLFAETGFPSVDAWGAGFLARQFYALVQWPTGHHAFSEDEDFAAMRRDAHRAVDFFLTLFDSSQPLCA